MDNNVTTSEKITKWLLIGISVLFLAVMLLLPLLTVITEAIRRGWKVYAAAVTDEYTIKALLLTVKATLFAVIFNTIFGVFAAWALTKFQFRGKKLLTTLIDLPDVCTNVAECARLSKEKAAITEELEELYEKWEELA